MSGPVWRFEPGAAGLCDICFRNTIGMFVEGDVIDNQLQPTRRVCSTCMESAGPLVVRGEAGIRRPGPAYAGR
jgi:hypothetical protein